MNGNYEMNLDNQLLLSFDKGHMSAIVVVILSVSSKKITLIALSKKVQATNTLRRSISQINEIHDPKVKIKKVLRFAS